MADKKFGIKDLAKSLGVQEATARKNLRDANIKKTGSAYEWNKGELDGIVKKLSAASPAPKKADKKSAGGKKTAKAGTKKAA